MAAIDDGDQRLGDEVVLEQGEANVLLSAADGFGAAVSSRRQILTSTPSVRLRIR